MDYLTGSAPSSSPCSAARHRIARLFVISGPSGAGKGTLIRGLLTADPTLARVAISATTRPMRQGEREGHDYFFLSRDEFMHRVAAGDFEEHVEFASHCYGTLKSEIDGLLAEGTSVILELEVDGSLVIRKRRPEACLIFIDCPADELQRRLEARGTETEAEIAERLRIAAEQSSEKHQFDHVLVNDDVEQSVRALRAIVQDESKEIA